MGNKENKNIFICYVSESALKVIKCRRHNSRTEFIGAQAEILPVGIDEKKIGEKISAIFKGLGYAHNPVILSLPRHQATCRNLKVPAQAPEEIAKIVSLQASKYLPYPANELISGYQVISTDNEGYSYVDMVIVHKDVIERYLRFFSGFTPLRLSIFLSSYGLCGLYNCIKSQDSGAEIIIDIDYQQIEIVIVDEKKLFFSRSLKIDSAVLGWEKAMIEEIEKTRNAYFKEVNKDPPNKIVIVGEGKDAQKLNEALMKEAQFTVDVLSYRNNVYLHPQLTGIVFNSAHSFAGLIGFGCAQTGASLNLLPEAMKHDMRVSGERRGHLKAALFIGGIILVFSLAVTKDLDNKTQYLLRLKSELAKIAKDAKPLEDIQKRFDLLNSRVAKKSTGLDIFYEVHRIIPLDVSLSSFSFEEDKDVILRGTTAGLNSVFAFSDRISGSAVFSGFTVKVRYATQKKTQSQDLIDFEIDCERK